MDDDAFIVAGPLRVPRSELTWRATRSGGPGGQHVNTSATRVELTWDVAGSPSLTEPQRKRLLKKLSSRLDGQGVLRLTESGSRSQHRNREVVTERFAETIEAALREPRPRKRTRPPRAAKEARLRAKKLRGDKKRLRGPVPPEE